jgi:ATP-binding cassette subfamily F protein 3
MSLLVCEGIAIAYGATTILSDVDLRIDRRQRLGVVGRNGAGKSSLLRVLNSELEPTSGVVERQRGLRVAHLPQDAPPPRAGTVLDEVLASRVDLAAMHAEMSRLEQVMSAGGAGLDAAMERYGELQHTYQDRGGYDLEARAREALGGLGLDEGLQQRHPAQLSGGQQRRVEMAKLLLADADLLLIDEPTNHLDLAAIEWLEDFMQGVGTAFVLVSHDRRFLDHVCTGMLEIRRGGIEAYPGNYSAYLRLRAERQLVQRREYEKQQAHITHQEEFIRRYKAGQRAREARGRQTKLDRLDRVAAPVEERRPKLTFATAPVSQVVLKATELRIGRGTTTLATLPPMTLTARERIAIVGANGSGKSTLMHTLAGELAPLEGKVTLGARTVVRLYRQDLGRGQVTDAQSFASDESRTVVEDLIADHPIGPERARTVLGALLFRGDDADKSVADLSGGERARLLLGKLALEPTNLLLLDEPTNHLDIPAQEVLEAALLRFPGAVILVSHDRALIDALATETWAIEEDGSVLRVPGGYSALLEARQRERRPAPSPRAAPQAPPPPKPADSAAARSRGAQARRLEAEIAEVEAALAGVKARLLDPETFRDPAVGAETGREHDRLAGALADLWERLEAVSD